MSETYTTENRTDGMGQPYQVRIPTPQIDPVASSSILGTQALTIPPVQTPALTAADGTLKGLAANLTSVAEASTKTEDTALSDVENLQNQLNPQTADQQALETNAGLPAMNKDLSDLNALQTQQLGGYLNSYNKLESGGTGTVGGVSAAETALQRSHAIDALMTSSLIQAKQGNITAATDSVNKAIAAKYEPIKQRLENAKYILSQVSGKAATDRANALTLKIKNVDQQEQDEKDALKTIHDAAANGAPSTNITEALKYTNDPATVESLLAGWASDPLDRTYKLAQIAKINNDIVTSGLSGVDAAQVLAYAQQYASNGQIPTGLPKGSFGLVAQAAKDLPKPSGTVVDMNTGIKSSKVTAAQEDGIIALKDLSNKLQDLKNLPRVGGPSTVVAYNGLRNEIVDLIARARTGAAISSSEEAMYKAKIPGIGSFVTGAKINSLENSLQGKLDTTLATNGLSMYGYSKVKLDGTDYTVGQIIQNDQGQSARVNPDGSLTPLN